MTLLSALHRAYRVGVDRLDAMSGGEINVAVLKNSWNYVMEPVCT
jgi:hypothetical protein